MIARHVLLLLSFVLAGLWLSARPSMACSCEGLTPPQLAATSDVIFTGVARAYVGSKLEDTVVEFEVGTVYKGPLARRAQVQALGGEGPSELGAGCGYGFQLGRRYTVFARDHDSDGVPNTNGCFRNVEGSTFAATYGLPAGQVPVRSDEVVPLSVVAALALVAIAGISSYSVRRDARS
ncbi:MAG TPA: hypothetical protein VGK15_00860 [Candidatus Limnocylindria bacterium]